MAKKGYSRRQAYNEPWRRKRQPIPVFLPGKSHEQRSLEGYSPWGHKTARHNLVPKQPYMNERLEKTAIAISLSIAKCIDGYTEAIYRWITISFWGTKQPAYFAKISQTYHIHLHCIYQNCLHFLSTIVYLIVPFISYFKLSMHFRFTLNKSIWENKHVCFFLMYIKRNAEY